MSAKAVSSAHWKGQIVPKGRYAISLTKMLNKIGPRVEPSGIPELIFCRTEFSLLAVTNCFLL